MNWAGSWGCNQNIYLRNFQVSDMGCQATEEDIALSLVSEQPASVPHLPFSGSEKHLGRILSDTKAAVQGEY